MNRFFQGVIWGAGVGLGDAAIELARRRLEGETIAVGVLTQPGIDCVPLQPSLRSVKPNDRLADAWAGRMREIGRVLHALETVGEEREIGGSSLLDVVEYLDRELSAAHNALRLTREELARREVETSATLGEYRNAIGEVGELPHEPPRTHGWREVGELPPHARCEVGELPRARQGRRPVGELPHERSRSQGEHHDAIGEVGEVGERLPHEPPRWREVEIAAHDALRLIQEYRNAIGERQGRRPVGDGRSQGEHRDVIGELERLPHERSRSIGEAGERLPHDPPRAHGWREAKTRQGRRPVGELPHERVGELPHERSRVVSRSLERDRFVAATSDNNGIWARLARVSRGDTRHD